MHSALTFTRVPQARLCCTHIAAGEIKILLTNSYFLDWKYFNADDWLKSISGFLRAIKIQNGWGDVLMLLIQPFSWTNVDKAPWQHMVLLDHKEAKWCMLISNIWTRCSKLKSSKFFTENIRDLKNFFNLWLLWFVKNNWLLHEIKHISCKQMLPKYLWFREHKKWKSAISSSQSLHNQTGDLSDGDMTSLLITYWMKTLVVDPLIGAASHQRNHIWCLPLGSLHW